MLTENEKISNDQYLTLINNLSPLLRREVIPQNNGKDIEKNVFNLSLNDEDVIREKIMMAVNKLVF